MKIAAIMHWLNSPGNYREGRELLERFGNHEQLRIPLKMICRGESSLTRDILRQELQRILENPPAEKAEPEPKVESAKRFEYSGYESLPADLKEVADRLKEYYGEIDMLRGRMIEVLYDENNLPRKLANNDLAGKYALSILARDRDIRDCFQELDHFTEHGTRLTPLKNDSEIEWLREALSNVVVYTYYVKKQQQRIKKGLTPANDSLFQERLDYIKKINEYLISHGRKPIH